MRIPRSSPDLPRLLARLTADHACFGRRLEGFVVGEIRKQLTWAPVRATPHHFRTAAVHEVDRVPESRDGRVVDIEVRASVTVSPRDGQAPASLHEAGGGRRVREIVLYGGRSPVPFGRHRALPVGALWWI